MEKLLEEVSFEAEERKGETVTIDAAYVRDKLTELAGDADLEVYPVTLRDCRRSPAQ